MKFENRIECRKNGDGYLMNIDIENKVVVRFIKYKDLLFFLMINLLGIFIRSFGISFLSEDMNGCLIPWYNSMKIGGGNRS